MPRRKRNVPGRQPRANTGLRSRASPSRLVKLYGHISPEQRELIEGVKFGGLLKIACHTIPAEFEKWLIVECFDAETMELVLPGRGIISVTAEAVSHILGLSNSGEEVKYELQAEAIKFIHDEYNIVFGTSPRIEAICERVKNNKEANDDFLRSLLMIAVSTFLCPPTSLGISPRCYPELVDLDRVKHLNWSQFVVDQLKDADSKLNNKVSLRGCILVLVILYADALDAPSLHIPNTTPRVAAWSQKLLDKITKLDTNNDGSFGKLKLKQLSNTTVQEFLFRTEDLFRFVASKVPRGMPVQDVRKLRDAASKMLCGMTDLLGSFLNEVGAVGMQAAQGTSGPSLRRSKRTRSTSNEEPDDEDVDYEEQLDEEDEEDDWEESDSEEDEDDEGEGVEQPHAVDGEEEDVDEEAQHSEQNMPSSSDAQTSKQNTPSSSDAEASKSRSKRCRSMNDSNTDLHPISEGNEEGLPEGQGERHTAASNPHEQDDSDEADKIPLIKRLRTLKETIQPAPLETIPAPIAKDRRARLRLREPGTSTDHPIDPQSSKSASERIPKRSKSGDDAYQRGAEAPPIARSNSLDFTPPEIDIMKFVEETDPSSPATQPSNPNWLNEPGFACYLDGFTEEALREIEENSIKQLKLKASQDGNNAAPSIIGINSSQKDGEVRSSEQSVEILEDQRRTPEVATTAKGKEPLSANSSVTPAFQPTVMRRLRKPAVLKSPYADTAPKKSFHSSKEVCQLYDAIIKTHGNPSRSRDIKSEEMIIVNLWPDHIFLHELANLVKPNGHLINTVAERYLLSGDLDRAEIKRLFNKGTNHLDHRQMVMFPVLQAMKAKNLGNVGHYFLLVLNIPNKRFEVLDSMRTLEDMTLKTCCDEIVESIKHLWSEFYSESKVVIENYEIVSISVPPQNNNHDCGFHMLMHAEHWDGRKVCNFNYKDIPNIRKLLTYKWFTHEENDTKWKSKFLPGK